MQWMVARCNVVSLAGAKNYNNLLALNKVIAIIITLVPFFMAHRASGGKLYIDLYLSAF